MLTIRAAAIALLMVPGFLKPADAAPKSGWVNDVYVLNVTVDGGGIVSLGAMVREIDGKLAVCGATWISKESGTARAQRRNIMRTLLIDLNGTNLPVSASNFAIYASQQEAETGGGVCTVTKKAWKKDYARAELVLRLSSTTYRGN